MADPGRRASSIYPYLKRFTWLSHLWLGAVDGLAPIGAWVAITGRPAVAGLGARRRGRVLGGGFDLFYALLDVDFDRREGLHSCRDRASASAALLGRARAARRDGRPARRGRARARQSASLYWLGVVAVAALLIYEHSLVRPGDLRRLDTAFFTMNGVISVDLLRVRPCVDSIFRDGPVNSALGRVIHARKLSKRFGDKRVLERLDLEVPRGGFVLVTGPNGSGKTTLLRLCRRALRADRRRARGRRAPRRDRVPRRTSRSSTGS